MEKDKNRADKPRKFSAVVRFFKSLNSERGLVPDMPEIPPPPPPKKSIPTGRLPDGYSVNHQIRDELKEINSKLDILMESNVAGEHDKKRN